MIFRDKKKFVFASVGIVALIMASLSSAVSAEVFYNQQIEFEQDGRTYTRIYQLTVPSSYDGSPVPLVLDLHGFTGDANEQAAKSGFRELAEQEGFIVVHPQGWGYLGGWFLRGWNAFDCCGKPMALDLDDVGLMVDIVDKVSQEYNINSSRVYATGHSAGANLAHKLACEAPEKFAGVIPFSMPIFLEGQEKDGEVIAPCDPVNAISVIHYHGKNDEVNPYDGKDIFGRDAWVPEAKLGFERWKDMNHCLSEEHEVTVGSEGHTTCYSYSECTDNVNVTLCAVEKAGHEVYDDDETDIDIAKHAWDLIKVHTR